MLIFKFLFTILLASAGIACFVKNDDWARKLQTTFILSARESKQEHQYDWKGKTMLMLCKAMIYFVGVVLVLSAYPLSFGPIYL